MKASSFGRHHNAVLSVRFTSLYYWSLSVVEKSCARHSLSRPFDAGKFHDVLSGALGLPRVEPERVVNLPMPRMDSGSQRFRDEFLQREVVRKFPGFDLGVDTRKAAMTSFFEDEQLNAETNHRLHTLPLENPGVGQIISSASRKVARVLGRWSWDRFEEGLRYGPGATTSLKRDTSGIRWKLQLTPHCSSSALPLWKAVLLTRPFWADWQVSRETNEGSWRVHDCDQLLVVPKNALTGRTIGKGPDANVMMQLAVGYCLRRKLYMAGVNLNDQTINQRRALAGSVSASYATVDLKSASNSVTTALVWQMVGNHSHDFVDPRWYLVMDALRTERVMLGGKSVHVYQLFSCMGNGFTFELESLLFWALARATCEFLGIDPDVTVYGDDLVVPNDAVDLMEEVFGWCGLRFNRNKTFSNKEGPLFRESCGKCYYNGVDVTAFYVDKPITTASDIFVLANNIKRWARIDPATGLTGLDGRLHVVWDWVVSHLRSRSKKFLIPFGDEDDGLITDYDQALVSPNYQTDTVPRPTFLWFNPRVLRKVTLGPELDESEAYMAKLYSWSYRRFQPPTRLPACLRQVPLEKDGPEIENSGHTLWEARRKVTHWEDAGPWIHTTDTALYRELFQALGFIPAYSIE